MYVTAADVKLNIPADFGLTMATCDTFEAGDIFCHVTTGKPSTYSKLSVGKLSSCNLTLSAALKAKYRLLETEFQN